MWVTSLMPHESQVTAHGHEHPYSCFSILRHIFSIYKLLLFFMDNFPI